MAGTTCPVLRYPWRIGRQRVGGDEGVRWVDHALAPGGQSPYDGRGRGTAKDPLWAKDMEPLFELDMRLPPPQSRQLVRFLHGELRAAIVDGRLSGACACHRLRDARAPVPAWLRVVGAAARRVAGLRALTQRAVIVEDDYDGEFRYDGATARRAEDHRPLRRGVLRRHVFQVPCSQALRLGYVVPPPWALGVCSWQPQRLGRLALQRARCRTRWPTFMGARASGAATCAACGRWVYAERRNPADRGVTQLRARAAPGTWCPARRACTCSGASGVDIYVIIDRARQAGVGIYSIDEIATARTRHAACFSATAQSTAPR